MGTSNFSNDGDFGYIALVNDDELIDDNKEIIKDFFRVENIYYEENDWRVKYHDNKKYFGTADILDFPEVELSVFLNFFVEYGYYEGARIDCDVEVLSNIFSVDDNFYTEIEGLVDYFTVEFPDTQEKLALANTIMQKTEQVKKELLGKLAKELDVEKLAVAARFCNGYSLYARLEDANAKV